MAFQQGLSGLNAASKALDVVSNNVANGSTIGYKSSAAHFGDVFAASLSGGGASQVGIGTTIGAVQQQFTQGNITATSNPLDIAINGGGFFKTVRDSTVTYTRNGQFHSDKAGYIVNDQGFQLMGYPATTNGAITASNPVPILVSTANIAPQATGSAAGGNATAVVNLDSRSAVPTVSPFNYQNPLSYNFSTAMTVYDTLGVDHSLTMYFVKTATAGTWNVNATLDGATPLAMANLVFNSSGQLTSPAAATALPATWALTTGAVTPMGSGLPNWLVDFTGTTSYGGASSANSMTQGGYSQGALSGMTVGKDGVIKGNYSNGQTKSLGQVVLTTFPNPNGLVNLGNNQFQSTSVSGDGLDGAPGAGSRGVLQSASVEESNVDLTAELVNMITLQRNYQSNAQSIKTQDQILQTLVNLR
ncbi:MAG: flagellar hook protein FlgE [Betaproteobacteria bacterium]